jgi:hypothetical protein
VSARNFVAYELIADLRPVAVHDAEVPAITRKIDNCRQAFARVAELVSNCRSLARR